MTIQDTMSVVASNAATNIGASGTSNTQFTLNVNYTISGPGNLYGYQNNSKNYGPFSFAPYGSPGDSVMLGPDTLFNNVPGSLSSGGAPPFNPAPYQGTGTISDTIAFGGGTTSSSGNNFAYVENAKYWGTFRITYYWCPDISLATTISSFTATQQNNYILLKWTNANEQNNTNYEIQISTDGKNFTSLGETESNPATAGTAAEYQYQYNLNQAPVGNLYFRIQETDATGKITYSEVLVVSPGGANAGDQAPISYQTYPNPATNSLIFQFNKRTDRTLSAGTGQHGRTGSTAKSGHPDGYQPDPPGPQPAPCQRIVFPANDRPDPQPGLCQQGIHRLACERPINPSYEKPTVKGAFLLPVSS